MLGLLKGRVGGLSSKKLRRIVRKCSRIDNASPSLKGRIDEILAVKNPGECLDGEDEKTERSLPGEEQHLKSGYYQRMLRRYMVASHFAKGKRVLDSCCGMGWGAHLVAANAAYVIGLDTSPQSIAFSRAHWKSNNLDYVCADALLGCFKAGSFDIVLCMEVIEHFSREEAGEYLDCARNMLGKNGCLIGSSYFPDTREAADVACSKNPFHKYIYTGEEIRKLLGERFNEVFIAERNIFVAR